jgi:PAS domain S-box-containing protein
MITICHLPHRGEPFVYHRDPVLPSPPADLDPDGERHGLARPRPDRLAGGVWRDVVEALPGVVLLLNGDHVCTYASPGVHAELGIPPDAVIGLRPESLIDAEHHPEVWGCRAAAAAGERGVTARVRIADAAGDLRWFESAVTQLVDPDTDAVYSAVHLRRITAEVEAQAALTRCNARYRSVLAAVDEAVLQLDSRGRIESFNPQALALAGRTADELLGADAVAVLDLRDRDGRPVTGPIERALALTGEPDGEAPVWHSLARGDGERRLVRVSLTSFTGPRPLDGGAVVILKESAAGSAAAAPTLQQARSAAGLTAREGDVLDGLAAGGDVPTIARQLGISVHSVRGHVKSITAKLGVHSQLQAVIAAARRGMIDLAGPAPA